MLIKATANMPAGVNGGKAVVESFNVNIPNDLDGLVKSFGKDVCTEMLKKALVIQYQAFARGKMVKREEGEITGVGVKGAALQKAVDEYKPSLRKAGKSFLDKFRDKAKTMSEEEKRALLAELTGGGGAKSATPRASAPAPRAQTKSPTRRPAA